MPNRSMIHFVAYIHACCYVLQYPVAVKRWNSQLQLRCL